MPKQNQKLKLFFFGILFFAIFGLAKNASAGTAFYFDGSDSGSQNLGTYAEPFNTMTTVNNYSFATGDDLYFKAGTTYVVPTGQYLNVAWNGTSGDHVTIGAYYGENQFGLNGGARPILDGNGNTAPARDSYVGMVTKWNSGCQYPGTTKENAYLDIKDLEVDYAGFNSFVVYGLSHVTIKNCKSDRSWWSGGIVVVKCDDVIVGGSPSDGNVITRSRYSGIGNGAGIEITGVDVDNLLFNVTCSYNRVDGPAEGIGAYPKAKDVVIEHNVIFDCYSVGIYVAQADNVTVRYNIVYKSASWGGNFNGFQFNNEDEGAQDYYYLGHARFYGNVVANVILAFNGADQWGYNHNESTILGMRIFNNTFVDSSDATFDFWGDVDLQTVLKNNISYLLGRGSHYVAHLSPVGVTFDYNNFSDNINTPTDPNKVIGIPTLSKTTGWRTIPADGEDINDWNILEGSNCIDAGTNLTTISTTEGSANNTMPVTDGYWFGRGMFVAVDNNNDGVADFVDTVSTVDYTEGAFVVTLNNSHTYTTGGKIYLAQSATSAWSGAGPDIGAYEYENESGPDITPPALPTGLAVE